VKVVATSDLHGSLPSIPECDLLIIAGDVCPDFIRSNRKVGLNGPDKGEQRQANWLRTTFNPWLAEQPAEQIVGIAGNHDFVFEHRFLLPKGPPLKWVYLQDSLAEIQGLRIYGLPWVPNLPFWAFHARAEALAAAYEAVPPCDVLLSHGPPLDYGDKCGPKYGMEGLAVGAVEARFAIERCKPMFFINGHIHEGYGEYEHAGCRILNVAHNDASYSPVNPPVEVEL